MFLVPLAPRSSERSGFGQPKGRSVLMCILNIDVLSAVTCPEKTPQVRAWLSAKPDSSLLLSVIALGEIQRSIVLQHTANPEFAHNRQIWLDRIMLIFENRILPFGAEDARIWGQLNADIEHAGADLMVAATALNHEATIVTGNVTDFALTGVLVKNPLGEDCMLRARLS